MNVSKSNPYNYIRNEQIYGTKQVHKELTLFGIDYDLKYGYRVPS